VRCLGVPDSDTLYIAKHNGIPYFDSVNQHPSELAKMLPLPRLQQDLSTGQVANFNYVIPDECTDMHGAPPVCVDSGNPGDVNDNWLVSTADQFVGNLVQGITTSGMWSKGNNAVVVTWDEGADNGGCCGTVPGSGQVPSIVVTSHGPRHVTDPTPYNHYSLLSTLQHTFGVGCLQATCNTSEIKPMAPLLATPGSAAQPYQAVASPSGAALGSEPPNQPSAPVVAGPTATLACNGGWQVVPSPNLSSRDNNLASVSAASARDVWAVGNFYTDANPNVFRNLGVHWDGSRWTAVALPNAGLGENTLFGVSALPSGRAWAAGYSADDAFRIRSLIERWDGSSWSIVPSPDPGSSRDTLFSVAALSDRDVWAVGGSQDVDKPFHTLVEHWDGARWSVVPSPSPGPNGDELFGVSATSPDDVWAVGQQQGGSFPSKALVEHWDGTAWRVADSPSASSQSYDPYAAAGTLAVGDREDDQSPQRTLAFATGQTAATPNVGAGENDLYAVAAKGGSVWAAGRVTDPANDNTSALIERLHDGSWTVVPTPNPGGNSVAAGLGGITATSPAAVWAVGSTNDGIARNRTLIEHTC
jgi:hypothetical protein